MDGMRQVGDALGREKMNQIKDAIGNRASDLIDKGVDAVFKGGTDDVLLKEGTGEHDDPSRREG